MSKIKNLKERIIYLIIFILLLIVEILIGLFVHDSFIRPYFGDTLVVILLWAFIRIFIPDKPIWLSLIIFLFATIVELTQLIPLVDLLGIKNQIIRTLMGTSFAYGDLLAYASGCIITAIIDIIVFKHKNRPAEEDKI